MSHSCFLRCSYDFVFILMLTRQTSLTPQSPQEACLGLQRMASLSTSLRPRSHHKPFLPKWSSSAAEVLKKGRLSHAVAVHPSKKICVWRSTPCLVQFWELCVCCQWWVCPIRCVCTHAIHRCYNSNIIIIKKKTSS